MTYGIAQSLHTTLADILLFRQRNADEVRIEEVSSGGIEGTAFIDAFSGRCFQA